MSDYPGTGRLEPEVLAAYIDGELPQEERARVEAEIAADPENYEWLVNAIVSVDDESVLGAVREPARPLRALSIGEPEPLQAPAPPPAHAAEPGPASGPGGGDEDVKPRKVLPFYRRPSVMSGIGALAVAASVLLVVQLQPEWYLRLRGPQVDPRFAKLVEAVGDERYIEARLTGGFKYGPLRQVMRGGLDLSKQSLELLAVAAELRKAAGSEPSAENLHAWGVAQVLLGDAKAAILAFQRAAAVGPVHPNLLVDLSAAHILLAEQSGDQGQLSNALKAASDALGIEPSHREALYNKALALERIGNSTAAKLAWEEFAKGEFDAQWRGLAERRVKPRPTSLLTPPRLWMQLASALNRAERGVHSAAGSS